jgi:hypothetical protein
MTNKQGLSPINELRSNNEFSTRPVLFPEQKINSIEQNSFFDGNPLVKTILFICNDCDGPLAPSSSCIVCKRTLQRKCTKCGVEIQYGKHVSCEYLTSFGKFIKQIKPIDVKPTHEVIVGHLID